MPRLRSHAATSMAPPRGAVRKTQISAYFCAATAPRTRSGSVQVGDASDNLKPERKALAPEIGAGAAASLRSPRPHGVDARGPVEGDVVDRRLDIGEQRPQARDLAALEHLDQDTAVGEAADAHMAGEVIVRRIAYVVVEDEPILEERAERLAAHLNCDGLRARSVRRRDLVERALTRGVEMRLRAGADIAVDRHEQA